MAKAKPSELNARIIIEKRTETINGRDTVDVWSNVFGEGVTLAAKWRTNTRAADVSDNERRYAMEAATVTVRRVSGIDASCRIIRLGDSRDPWRIVGAPEFIQNCAYISFTVERGVAAV